MEKSHTKENLWDRSSLVDPRAVCNDKILFSLHKKSFGNPNKLLPALKVLYSVESKILAANVDSLETP